MTSRTYLELDPEKIVGTIRRLRDRIHERFPGSWLEAACQDFLDVAHAARQRGAGIFFLVTIETRLRRRATLGALHELRSLVHVVDMHQLAKDPEYPLDRGEPT